MSEHDRHMVVIDADVSRFKRKMAEATDDATRRLRDTAREANAAFAPAGQMRGRSIGAKFGTGARSLINPRDIRIIVPEDHPRSRKELPQRPSLGDGLGALAREGLTAFDIGEVFKNVMKGRFPVVSGPMLALEAGFGALPKSRSTTLGPVLDRFQEDLNELKNLQTLSPGEMELGRLNPERIKKNADVLRKSINDAVVSVEDALLQSARGLEALRRPNEGKIPGTVIGKVNVAEFEALKDALGVMAETVNDPKLQQQIQDVLNKQEFFSRTGREPEPPTAPTPGFTNLPLPGERDVARSEFLGTARPGGSGRVQFAGLGFSDAGGFGGADFDQAEESLARFHERLGDLPGAFAQATGPAGELASQFEALNVPLVQTNTEFGEQFRLLGDLGGLIPEVGGQFSAFLERTAEQGQVLNQVIGAVGQSFLNAFEGAIQRGESLGDVLKSLIVDLAEIALRAAGNKFLELFLGSLFGPSGPGPGAGPPIRFAQGAAFGPGGRFLSLGQGAAFGPGGRFLSLARGGAFMGAIVDTPTAFRFARGVGVMGEAGPEAVLPLTRARSGELGVKALMPREEEKKPARIYRLAA